MATHISTAQPQTAALDLAFEVEDEELDELDLACLYVRDHFVRAEVDGDDLIMFGHEFNVRVNGRFREVVRLDRVAATRWQPAEEDETSMGTFATVQAAAEYALSILDV